MSTSSRTSVLSLVLMAGAVLCLAGCGGGGGGDDGAFSFTAGTSAGDTYIGDFWPLDVGRWWSYNGTGQITGSGAFSGIDEDVTGTLDVNVQRAVNVALDTGTVSASEFYVSPLDTGGGGGSPAPGPGSQSWVLLGRLKQIALQTLRVKGGAVASKQLPTDVPDLGYYANIAGTRIEKVGYGYSWSGTPIAIASPRCYLPIPLVAETPVACSWNRVFGNGSATNADELLQELEASGFSGTISYTLGVAGLEQVTTPAGTFSALRIHQYVTIDVTGSAGETATVTLTYLLWLADGVGDVQERFTLVLTASAPGEGSGTLRLTGDAKLTGYGL